MDLREATPADAPSIALLVNSAYRGESSRMGWTTEADLLGGQRTDPESVRLLIADPKNALLVAPDFSGCVLLERKGSQGAYLGLLTVKPELQNAGLGRWILEQAEQYAQSQWKVSTLEMTVISARTELVAWYERRGYRRTGEMRPFPMQDPLCGLPKVPHLEFCVLSKRLSG